MCAQSRARGIQGLHTAGLRYKTTATELKCSNMTFVIAIHSTDSESPAIKRGQTKMLMPDISYYIETLSLMDSLLTNDQIKAKVQERWPNPEVSCNMIREARMNLGFKFRSPMIKPDLSPEHRFQCHQFSLDIYT
jgi:hypothetical protein